MASTVILWLILGTTVIATILAAAALVRASSSIRSAARDTREEFRQSRDESRVAAKDLREEVSGSIRSVSDSVTMNLDGMASIQRNQIDSLTKQLKDLTESNQRALDHIRETFDSRVKELQEGNEKKLGEVRREVSEGLKTTSESLGTTLDGISKVQQSQLEVMTKHLKDLADANQAALDRIRATFDQRVKELQDGNEQKLSDIRKEVSEGARATNENLGTTLESLSKAQQAQLESMTNQLKGLTQSNQGSLDSIRTTFDLRVKELQEGNEKKLDEMRKTVDEKLHDTLEKRLGESFKLVSDRLEAVHKGLGEMHTLANGVGDLKRVLTNVKARGTWAEVQLGAILEQVLSAEQFERNVCVKTGTAERVEYAIRLPGPKDDPRTPVWLPIDSKFPQEDYIRLQDAAERGDPEAVQAATDSLARTIRVAAKDIHDKYINPPGTTDFAIMFLATEGLYAEVLRQPVLVEELQQRFRVVLAGPTTLVAILSSLRMGFQTLAIEQRASEVWRVLGAVKTEFGKFGDVLNRVKRQLDTASRTIEQTGVRSRAMERKLRSVEQLPEAEASELLPPQIAGQDDDAGISEFVLDDASDAPDVYGMSEPDQEP